MRARTNDRLVSIRMPWQLASELVEWLLVYGAVPAREDAAQAARQLVEKAKLDGGGVLERYEHGGITRPGEAS